MRTLRAILHEVIGLFVDDGALALALVLWCAAIGLVVRLVPAAIVGSALLAGCVGILLVNVITAARKRRAPRG